MRQTPLLGRWLSSTDTSSPGILLGKRAPGIKFDRSNRKEIGGTLDKQTDQRH